LAAHYAEHGKPKGEIVVLVGPPPAITAPDDATLKAALEIALKTQPTKTAANAVAAQYNLPRRLPTCFRAQK
jgi:16S rRNA (cytidine1402-2'-O)-methyltransferase